MMRNRDTLQEYQELGTVPELRAKLSELKRWHTRKRNDKVRDFTAQESTIICHCCDHKDEYIEELQGELSEYKEIGNVDQFRELKEKAAPMKIFMTEDSHFRCPECGNILPQDELESGYCRWCGQALTRA